jgi:hypothetical protein
MPEKSIDKQIMVLIVVVSFLGGLVKALDDGENVNWKHLLFQTIIGGFSGVIFGLLTCYVFGENMYLVGAVSGAGGVLGMKGLKSLSETIRRFIEFSLRK